MQGRGLADYGIVFLLSKSSEWNVQVLRENKNTVHLSQLHFSGYLIRYIRGKKRKNRERDRVGKRLTGGEEEKKDGKGGERGK
jgi:hypothetical protein